MPQREFQAVKLSQFIDLHRMTTAPDVAPANGTRLYYDESLTALMISVDGGAYAPVADLTGGGVTASAAEINKLAGVSVGVASASKAAVLGTNKNLDQLALAALYLGAGAGTLVVVTAAQLNQIVAAFGTVTFSRAKKWAKVGLNAVDSAGGVFAWANPEAGSIIVMPPVIRVTTIATGTCKLDVGAQETGATTLSDNLLDGVDVHSATGAFGQLQGDGVNGLSAVEIASGKWVTGSVVAGGASAGIVGSAYIPYLLA